MGWLRKRIRNWRRARAALAVPQALPAMSGTATVILCHPSASAQGPCMHTVLRPGIRYSGVLDTEIRGFLDGSAKFRRNVATQYHVRIGCEASKPVNGRYEVMRLLQRWDLGSLPSSAKVESVTLTLVQEDIRQFPHRNPLISPVDFFVYEVKKSWGAGRGGVNLDNQSEPEPGDAWWLDAKLGELPWTRPGCGFASDSDPTADRGAEPLAHARLEDPTAPLVFSGPRLAAHIERLAAAGKPLEVIVKASDEMEARPGSIRAFYSREHGDDLNPVKRPSLAIVWTAPTLEAVRRPFVLKPGQALAFRPAFRIAQPEGSTLHASISLDAPHPLVPAVDVSEDIRILSDAHAVRAGEMIAISILETWAPDVAQSLDLRVELQLTAPSGRTLDLLARLSPPFTYTCEQSPDELGVWRYAWRTLPDRRFPAHTGQGCFTVVRGEGDSCAAALRGFAEAALAEAAKPMTLAANCRIRLRLTRLESELSHTLGTEEIRRRISAALEKLD